MKKYLIIITLLLLSSELYPQSKIVFSIDSPLAGPVKPKYQMFDYSIPFKLISVIRGAYSGIELVFSEDESKQEFYRFVIELPEINKLKFVSVSEDGKNKYVLENEGLPLILNNDDFNNIYSQRLQKYVQPKINLEKYTRTDINILTPEKIEFKYFTLTISELVYESNLVSLKASVNGSVFFSSDIRYDAPYELNAVIELEKEELSKKFAE
ncbi:MAG: hypothetical protein JW917_03055 [Ignavibacteria bacterium]|nr:hypothetical protein [Ignavibacteria bacterium]